ncbi:MAG: hypothetical protein ACLPVF_16805 [Acidimicrobiales bacterium]
MAPVTCSNCQSESAEGTQFCANCGAALAGAPAAAAPPGSVAPPAAAAASATPPQDAPAPPAASSTPQIKFDASQLERTDWIVGIASFVLLISLFLSWFSVSFGSIGSASADGVTAHGYLWIVFILCLGIIVLLALQLLNLWAMPDESPVNTGQILLIATVINLVLVVLAFLFKPGGIGSGVGWSFGAFVGLVAAIVAVVPLARPALAARKAK